MKKVELLPHNEAGYKKLIECLEKHNITTINHATGTGKSFILLKYMLEHQNQKIMFMAPTYPIIDQIKNEHIKDLDIGAKELSHVDSMIYPNLLNLNNKKEIEEFVKKYDVIILDEYHRCGSKEWGKKINTIKQIIKEKYPEKRIIGTTATEIRYLDNEKNMKDLLFDGIEASRLDLVDAILQGISPVPSYYNFDIEALDRIENIRKRVKKYIINKKELDIIEKDIELVKKQSIDNIYNSDEIKKYIKNNWKYLVFSSSIDNISKDKEVIKKLFKDIELKEYVVHSHLSKEKNLETLEKFRNAEKDSTPNILYSINILSEGVHIKDVDAEFQFRKTTSPILYFQLIGRLLSYSQRKKQVIIFDLANNLNHHKAIRRFYSDLINRAKKIIEKEPNNKICVEILTKLKIVDKTTEVHKLLDELDEKYSKSNLIKKIIEECISTIETNETSNYLEIYKAQTIIKKYYKFIDIQMFEKIKKIGLLKDQKLFQFSVEEFKKLLNGYDNLYELIEKKYNISFNKIKNFLSREYRIPSLFSDDKKEIELAIEMNNYFEKYSNSQRDNIRSYISDEDTMYERILYQNNPCDINNSQLVNEIKYIMTLNIPIKRRIISYLQNKDSYSIIVDEVEKYNEKLLIKTFDESIDSEKKLVNRKSEEINKQTLEVIEELLEKHKEIGMSQMLDDAYKKIIEYIKEYKTKPEYVDDYKRRIRNNNAERWIKSRKLYLLGIVLAKLFDTYGYTEKINNALIETDKQETKKVTREVIDFMKKNNYRFPSVRSSDKSEISLAIAFKNIRGKIDNELQEELNENLDNNNKKKKEIIDKMYGLILKYIGKPAIFTERDNEILKEYNIFKNNFTQFECKKIERAKKISELFYFIIRNNYEFPSEKNSNKIEENLAKYYNLIKNDMSPEEQEIFKLLKEKMKIRKKEFLVTYKEFIKKNGRLPGSFNEEEGKLQASYNRLSPYFTLEDQKRISLRKTTSLNMMRNAYDAMQKDQEQKGMKF